MEFDLRWMQNYGCRSHVTISCKYVCMSVVTSCCVVQVVSHLTSARNLRNGISLRMNVSFKKKGVALSVLYAIFSSSKYGWQARCLIALEQKDTNNPFTQRKTFHKERNETFLPDPTLQLSHSTQALLSRKYLIIIAITTYRYCFASKQ